jgi:hypothetical protein
MAGAIRSIKINKRFAMKKMIILLLMALLTLAGFANKKANGHQVKKINNGKESISSIKIGLEDGGKISLSWAAVMESTTTVYRIDKSINGGEFAIAAYVVGESNKFYTYSENLASMSGTVAYRVVSVNKNEVTDTLTKTCLFF